LGFIPRGIRPAWQAWTDDPAPSSRPLRPSRRDIRPLLEQRNIAYTSWEGWHHRSDAAQPSIDWQDLISSAHGIPVWL